MRKSTRELIVEAANRRFYADGFRGVGIEQIYKDVGISKTAFYNHFDSKDDLLLEVLRVQDEWLRTAFSEMIREEGGGCAIRRLRAIFDVVDQIISREEYRGCFFVNVAMEFPLPHDPAHVAAARNKAAIEDIIRETAEAAGASDPVELARELLLIMDGAYVMRQVTRAPETIDVARRLANRAIEAHVEGA